MNRIYFSWIIILATFLNLPAQDNEILMTIGDTKVSKAEFERIYQKNNSNLYDEKDRKSPKEYLDLFINFKLKVIEAQALKLDTNKTYINELAGYRKELAAPYLTDIKYSEKMVNDMYYRMTKEVNASHILLRLEQNAPPEKDKEVLAKILKIREEILAGKDFNVAAAEYSEDPSAKTNGGNLGFFSAFQMVVPFEDAAFTTPVGELSEPVRSSFGYHLLKVHDLRENQGEIHVAHIMKMFPEGSTPEVKKEMKNEIELIYKELQEGADFAELAKLKSDDKRSAPQGGEMAWFSAGRMVPEFADASFALEHIGDYSLPIETPYGYHIIKKLDIRPVKPFEEAKADIESRIQKDPARNNSSKKAFIDKLKVAYDFKEFGENLKKLDEINDNQDKDIKLFVIDNKEFTSGSFDQFLQKSNIEKGKYRDFYEKWLEHEITELEDAKLEDKYPDFRYLMQEYHDGILLFNISEEKIWNYAVKDSAGLETFYSKKKKKYKWEERFEGIIISCKDLKTREEAEKFFASGMTVEEISDMLNTEHEMVIINKGTWEKGSHSIIDYYVWNGTKPQSLNTELTFIRGDKIKPTIKTLDEARGLYISDYQNFLEKEWIKSLRKKYKTTVNKKILKSIKGV